MNIKVSPLADRVLVRQEEQQNMSQGGIFLPETAAKEAPQWGTVVRTGPGAWRDGRICELSVKAGDRVIFGKYSGTKVKVGEEELLFLREDDILAVVG